MSLISTVSLGLDVEDFRRLGVRPQEARLSVIRQAAIRSALPLAQQQLTRPNEHTGMLLARVATSAYRLLDPRQRSDFYQRVHIGRILPHALDGAGQTSFVAQIQEVAGPPAIPFRSAGGGEVELDESFPVSTTATSEVWLRTLSDDDLLDSTPLTRRISRIRSRYLHRWILLSVAGLAVGTLLGLATIQQAGERLFRRTDQLAATNAASVAAPVIAQSSATDPPKIPTTATIPAAVTDPVATATTPAQPTHPATTNLATTDATGTADDAGADDDADNVAPVWAMNTLTPQQSAAGNRDEVIEATFESDTIAAAAPDAATGSMQSFNPLTDDGFLADPFASTEPDPVAIGNELMAASGFPLGTSPGTAASADALSESIDDIFADDVPQSSRLSLPEKSQIAAARQRLIKLVPSLTTAIPPQETVAVIAQLTNLQRDLPSGSADHFVSDLMIAELAWLNEDCDAVQTRLQAACDPYHSDVQPWLAETLVAAVQRAKDPATHRQLLTSGMQLADRLLIDEAIGAGKQVAQSLHKSAALLESESAIRDLDHFVQAADQMERLAQAADRALQRAGWVPPAGDSASDADSQRESLLQQLPGDVDDAASLGRYYGLMLRRWDLALPWLVHTSDPRVAALARDELQLGAEPAAADLNLIATRWLALAVRNTGRPADSMRLHAVDLMRDAHDRCSGLQQLEIDRQIDEVIEILPTYLQPRHAALADSAADATKIEPDPAATPPAKGGLGGRIRIDQDDLGVQIDYQLEVPITQAMLDAIADQLDQPLSAITIRFAGEFALAQDTTVQLTIAAAQSGVSQGVHVDQQPLTFDTTQRSAVLSLPAGKHTVVWTIAAPTLAEPVFLRIDDAATGNRITVTQPPAPTPPPTVLTVAMLRPGG